MLVMNAWEAGKKLQKSYFDFQISRPFRLKNYYNKKQQDHMDLLFLNSLLMDWFLTYQLHFEFYSGIQ